MFLSTRWSLIREAGSTAASRRAALEELCSRYRPAVLAYFASCRRPGEEAEDLAQSFFLELLESGLVGRADPDKGRFRSFLLGALRHHLQQRRDHARAERRGGATTRVGLEGADEVADDQQNAPEAEFERAWLRTLLGRALVRLELEAGSRGRSELYLALLPFLSEPTAPREYQELAERLSMRPNTLAVAVRRMRNRYASLVREELADTVASQGELQDELAWLGEQRRDT